MNRRVGPARLKQALLDGLALFLVSLASHVLLWRLAPRWRRIPLLLACFLLPPFLAFFCGGGPSAEAWLLHLALSFSYIQTYPAIQALSPTLRLLLILRDCEKTGLSFDEILARLNPRTLDADRVEDLLKAGFLLQAPCGELSVAPRAAWLLSPFLLLRRVLGFTGGPEG